MGTTNTLDLNNRVASLEKAIDGLTASDIDYDNTGSGLTATDVQGAIDEVATNRYKYKVVTISDRTVNGGYLDVIDSEIKLTSVVFVQLCRSSGIWEKYAVYPIINYVGYVTIYFRDTSNGQRPPDNSTVTFNLLIINT